jgi:hypothetical protein
MPLEVDKIMPDTPETGIQEAISQSIAQCMREPIPEGTDVDESNKQKWCSGKAYGIAREKSGKSLSFGKQQ